MWSVATHLQYSRVSFVFDFDCLIIICLNMSIFVFIVLDYFSSWLCRFMYFIQVYKFWAIIFSNVFLFLFLSLSSGAPIMYMLVHLIVYYRSLRPCKFFFIHFFFCSSGWEISINVSFHFSYYTLYLHYFSIIILLIFSICWSIVILVLFSFLSTIFFSSLNLFKTVY